MRYTEHDDDHWVRVRESVIDDGERRIKELEDDNAHLRSCLKRLEWEATPMGVYCRACGNNHGAGHTSDCWLAAECKEGK